VNEEVRRYMTGEADGMKQTSLQTQSTKNNILPGEIISHRGSFVKTSINEVGGANVVQ